MFLYLFKLTYLNIIERSEMSNLNVAHGLIAPVLTN